MSIIANGRDTVDVAIIGAGAAGIGAARRLKSRRPDLSVLLLEAGNRLGGRAWTVTPPALGHGLDLGCGWLHGASDNPWSAIARDLGFEIDYTPAPWDDDRRPLGFDEADWTAARTAMRGFFDRVEARPVDGPDGSLADMLEPGNPWNGRIEAIGTYINGVELDRASIADYNNYDPGPPPDWRVRDGYGSLVERFGASAPARFGTVVSRIDHRAADRIDLTTNRGTVAARAVVVAVPSDTISGEAIRFDPPLPGKVEAAASLPLGLADKLFLHVANADDLPADARLLGARQNVRTGAYQVRPFGLPVIEGYFGGQLARDLEHEGEQAAAAFAIDQLVQHFGSDFRRRLTFLAASAWAGTPHIGGSYSYARPGAALARAALAEPVDQRLYFIGEACASARFSTAHGAYETGVAAADRIAATI